jgi:hypothetical protein
MSTPFSTNNPGIGGINELTTAEEAIVEAIATLGSAGQSLVVNGTGDGVEWSTPAGGGDVASSANFGTDNVLIRSDGTTKNVQSSGVSLDNSDNMAGVNSINVTEIAAPSTPASGTVIIYAKTDGKLYIKDDTGTETDLTSGGGGGGNVSNTGTPANNQIAVWTDATTVEGDAALTFDTSTDTLDIGASGNLSFGGVVILDDTAGSMLLQNIDAISAGVESIIENAIDTLPNLTNIQSLTFTLADAGADEFFGS